MRLATPACRPTTTPADSGLWHFGAWVWRAPPGTVFTDVQANASLTNQAGHRGELVVVQPGGELIGFGTEHNDFRVHSIDGEFTQFHSWLRCVAPGAGPAVRAGRRRLGPRLRPRRLPAHRGPHRARTRDHRRLAARRRGRPRRPRADLRRRRRRRRRPQGLRRGATATQLVTDVRNCAVAGGFATALQPVPAARPASRRRCRPPTRPSSPARGTRSRPASRTWRSTAPPNRVCEPRQVWVDNACPASAVGGGSALSAGFGDGGAVESLVASDRRAADSRPAHRRRGGRDRLRADPGARRRPARSSSARPRPPAPTAPTRSSSRPGPSREVYVHYVVGDSVIARHGLVAALERAPGARRAPESRGPKPRPAPLLRHASGARLRRPGGEGPGAARQAPLAGLPHRPGRRRLRASPPATGCARPPTRGATASAPSSRRRPATRTSAATRARSRSRSGGGAERPGAAHSRSAARLASMSSSCSEIQTPGSRSRTISRRRSARRRRSSGSIVSAR